MALTSACKAALAHYGMIPEYTPVVTLVTTGRPGSWETPLGVYVFRHVKVDWFHGYRRLEVGDEQQASVATPEKALLDLIYLEPRADQPTYLDELRLQAIAALAQEEAVEYETL